MLVVVIVLISCLVVICLDLKKWVGLCIGNIRSLGCSSLVWGIRLFIVVIIFLKSWVLWLVLVVVINSCGYCVVVF